MGTKLKKVRLANDFALHSGIRVPPGPAAPRLGGVADEPRTAFLGPQAKSIYTALLHWTCCLVLLPLLARLFYSLEYDLRPSSWLKLKLCLRPPLSNLTKEGRDGFL